jgi:ribonuclease HI
MLLPIILGLCGKQKMSKSLNNYIAIKDEPFQKFGKVMSIPDSLMVDYYRYILFASEEECVQLQKGLENGQLHPNVVKKQLAYRVVAFFHGEESAADMQSQFERVFAQKQIPDHVESLFFHRPIALIQLLDEAGKLESKSEFRRLVQQKAVSFVEGEKILSESMMIDEHHHGRVLKIGKRVFYRFHYQDAGEKKNESSEQGGLGHSSVSTDANSVQKCLHLFSDGACRGNPGPGAWASLVMSDKGDTLMELSGVETQTTNNRMELMGAIQGFKAIYDWLEGQVLSSYKIHLFSDSVYVIEGCKQWLPQWKKRGWKKADGKSPENMDLWQQIDHWLHVFSHLQLSWVKGHGGHPQNEYCDRMANEALDQAGF